MFGSDFTFWRKTGTDEECVAVAAATTGSARHLPTTRMKRKTFVLDFSLLPLVRISK
jgi:hypothetical protein